MWGLPSQMLPIYKGWRFTPTYVGTSCGQHRHISRPEVHPHVCGDFARSSTVELIVIGSPPRMWGLQIKTFAEHRRQRFTPTYVGTSPRSLVGPLQKEVHPHVCGDFPYGEGATSPEAGSPPRMWGLPSSGRGPARLPRFTPTYVGTSGSSRRPNTVASVHPHVCGDFNNYNIKTFY